MLYYLYHFNTEYPPLRVFRYISFRAVMAALTALVLCWVMGPWIIRKLTELKIGQPIRTAEEVHRLHELHRQKCLVPATHPVIAATPPRL